MGLPVGQQSTKTTAQPGSPVADLCCQHPAATCSLTRLTTLINAHRRALGGRWQALPAHAQALMSLAHLRNGDTWPVWQPGSASASPRCGAICARRLTCSADAADGAAAAHRAARLTYVIFDGTLIPIDRVADQKPYHSGKHQRQGVNV